MWLLGLSFATRQHRVIFVATVALLCAYAAAAQRVKTSAWPQATDARASFEAEAAGTHTKAEYVALMDRFRAIYHANAGDTYAARSVQQVAELLAEEGREFADAKATSDAHGQYEFLARAYPGYARRATAAEAALDASPPASPPLPQQAPAAAAVSSPGPPRKIGRRTVAEEIAAARADDAADSESAPAPLRSARAKASDAGRTAANTRPEITPLLVPEPDDVTAQPATTPKQLAQVSAIRHWSTATYSRVVIDLGDAVQYQAARVENPDRIYFDLHHARLAQGLVGKSFAVTDDGFVTKIRAAQYSADVTRVVLDVHEVGQYSAFLLPNPYRLIIDIHGKAATGEQLAANRRSDGAISHADMASVAAADAPTFATAPARSADAETSTLPPMPVTDAAAAFGLPKKNSAANATAAQPRVVIPQKATLARPVPNTVSSRVADPGVEVAAVSRQQGRVEATATPTSQPIVERNSAQGLTPADQADGIAPAAKRTGRGKRSAATSVARVDGEPVEAAAPTADGATSLVRALGLKIGRIVIDAGHGGHDSGTLGAGGIEEKDVVLDVALRLGKLLHDRLGAEVVYTRADDTFIPLETRTAIANKAQADLFISIHANSSSDASARGVEVYYLNFTSDPEAMKVAGRENAVSTQSVHELSDLVKKIALKDKIDESKELATDVDQALYQGIEKGNAGLKNRGVKKAPFVVLIGANMPSILAEISFVTNPDDASELERPAYRERVAESLYNGVAQYAGGINGKKPAHSMERAAVR
jgi:N-acetylmuramoyl-L-alanine amidase